MRQILLSFDVEEFDMPLEYGIDIHWMQQMEIGYQGLLAISPILEKHTATLFTTANFADHYPEKIKSLSDQHEIASHTYYHSRFVRTDLEASKERLEFLTGKPVTGLRMPRMKATASRPVLDAGYAYDASIHSTWIPGRYNNLDLSRKPYLEDGLLRIPASVTPRWRMPLFWLSFKNFPYRLYRDWALRTLETDGHISLYFHPWEFTDLSESGLPRYTRRICGEALVERLYKLLDDLLPQGECCTMASFAASIRPSLVQGEPPL